LKNLSSKRNNKEIVKAHTTIYSIEETVKDDKNLYKKVVTPTWWVCYNFKKLRG
jgi:acyl CoA:acetate/3-ketoacid CoA transferase alpha subunit